MIKSLKIRDNLFINKYEVEIPKETKSCAQNIFLIFDRSGSMSGYLRDVVETAKDFCRNLPEGSTVSVGYFSGVGEYNLSVPYTLQKESGGVISTLDTYKHAISLTCFTEILQKVNSVSKKSGKASMFFFTDGCHNSGGTRKDIEAALKEWSQYAETTMFVGYGWIDRDMMSWMASICDGSFVYLDRFSNFKSTLSDFGLSVEDTMPSIRILFSNIPIKYPVSISGRNVICYSLDKDSTVSYKPSKSGSQLIYYLSETRCGDWKLTDRDMSQLERGARAIALIASQNNDVSTALELLNNIGDKHLVQSLYNAIAPSEFAQAETKIRQSIFHPISRFIDGKEFNYLPAPDAFCVMDVIQILSNDENVLLHLFDKDFEYERIGKKQEQTDGSKLVYPSDVAAKFNSIVMNQERLNVSISTVVNATVPLNPKEFTKNPFTKEDLFKFGLPDEYPVSVFRIYTIIADGKLQTYKLVVSNLSEDSVTKLSNVISLREDGKYILDLSSLPIINKTYVKNTSATSLARLAWRDKVISDYISTYKYLLKQEEESDEVPTYSDFLENHCYIRKSIYTPPKVSLSGDDSYPAYTFKIIIDGFTKPAMGALIKKVDSGGNISKREMFIADAYKNSANVNMIEEKERLTKELRQIRQEIQSSKFAIILANKGKMDEFESRENMKITLADANLPEPVTFRFEIKPITITI